MHLLETILRQMSSVKKSPCQFLVTVLTTLMLFHGQATFRNRSRYSQGIAQFYYCVAPKTELSDLDKQGIAQFYPKGASGNGCTTTYNPSSYRPGTSQWDGHIGSLSFYNTTNAPVTVTLYSNIHINLYFIHWSAIRIIAPCVAQQRRNNSYCAPEEIVQV